MLNLFQPLTPVLVATVDHLGTRQHEYQCEETKMSTSPSSLSHSAATSPVSLHSIIERLQQENRNLRLENDNLKLKVKSLLEEKRLLQEASVSIQARAEQEEEFISNTLLKKIQSLKREKEILAINYEQEEECITNDLTRQLNHLREEKDQLERTLEHETASRSGGRSRAESVNE